MQAVERRGSAVFGPRRACKRLARGALPPPTGCHRGNRGNRGMRGGLSSPFLVQSAGRLASDTIPPPTPLCPPRPHSHDPSSTPTSLLTAVLVGYGVVGTQIYNSHSIGPVNQVHAEYPLPIQWRTVSIPSGRRPSESICLAGKTYSNLSSLHATILFDSTYSCMDDPAGRLIPEAITCHVSTSSLGPVTLILSNRCLPLSSDIHDLLLHTE